MLLIRNGRVLDPASKTDAALDILIDGEQHRRTCRPAGRLTAREATRKFSTLTGLDRGARLYRHARATFASPARKTPKPSKPEHSPPRAADSPLSAACPTPSR